MCRCVTVIKNVNAFKKYHYTNVQNTKNDQSDACLLLQVLSVPDQTPTDLEPSQTITVLDSGDLLLGAGLGPEFANTTILYVQSDGSLVEGAGLTPEEHRLILDQLSKQTVVQVSDQEAAALLQGALVSPPSHGQMAPGQSQNTALDPGQLQQVINQVRDL